MSARNFGILWLTCALGLGVGSIGCSNDSSDDSAASSGFSSVAISSVGMASLDGGGSFDCVPSGVYPGGHLPITIAVTNFVLAPPGVCNGAPQCGQVALFIGSSEASLTLNNVGSGHTIDALPDDAGAFAAGPLVIRVELWQDSTGKPETSADGGQVFDELTVQVGPASVCGGPLPDAGTSDGGAGEASMMARDAMSDAAGDAPQKDDAPSQDGSPALDGAIFDGAPSDAPSAEGSAIDAVADGGTEDVVAEASVEASSDAGDGATRDSASAEGAIDAQAERSNDGGVDAPDAAREGATD